MYWHCLWSQARRGEVDSDEAKEGSGSEESETESDSSSEEDEDDKVRKPKGIQGLIECENPNRAGAKANRKITDLDVDGKPQLTRREKEEIQKQRAIAHHQAGKSDQARADMERLAIVRAKRAEAEQKKKELQQGENWDVSLQYLMHRFAINN